MKGRLGGRNAESMAILLRDALLAGWESSALLAILHYMGVSRVIVDDAGGNIEVWFGNGGLIRLPSGELEMVGYSKANWLYRNLCSFFNHFCVEAGECYEWLCYCRQGYTVFAKHSRIISRVRSHARLCSVPVSVEGYSPREVEVLAGIPVAFSYSGTAGKISTLGSTYILLLEGAGMPLSISASIRAVGGRAYVQLHGYRHAPLGSPRHPSVLEYRTFSVGEYVRAVDMADRVARRLALEASRRVSSVEGYPEEAVREALKSLIDHGYMTADDVVLGAVRLQLLLIAEAFRGAGACR